MWVSKKQIQEVWRQVQKYGEHVAVLNGEMSDVLEQTKHVPVMRRDIGWLKWLVCAIFIGIVLGLIEQFFGI